LKDRWRSLGTISTARSNRATETADVVATQQVKRSPRTIADIFAKHGEAVLTGPVTAVDRPIRGASAVAELKSGTKLTVVEAKNHGADQARVKVRAPGLDRTAYIPLSGNTVVKTTNIGKPLKEIVIGGVRGSIEGRVDTAPATEGLQELRSAGRSVAWISISTPKADDQSARELFTLRVADLIHALDEQGVPRQRISVAGETPSFLTIKFECEFSVTRGRLPREIEHGIGIAFAMRVFHTWSLLGRHSLCRCRAGSGCRQGA
jgi:hypothetical protein